MLGHVIANYSKPRCHFRVSVEFSRQPCIFFCRLRKQNFQFDHFGDRDADDFDGALVADEELGDFVGTADGG